MTVCWKLLHSVVTWGGGGRQRRVELQLLIPAFITAEVKFTEKAVAPRCGLAAMWRLQRGCWWKGKIVVFYYYYYTFLGWQTSHWPRLRRQKTSEVCDDWQLVDKVMVEKLATWLRAMALIPSLSLPASTFDISDAWWHYIWPSDGRESLLVAAFVIVDEILRLTPPKNLQCAKALKLFTLDKIPKMIHNSDP